MILVSSLPLQPPRSQLEITRCSLTVPDKDLFAYAYRLFLPKSVWTQVLAGLSEEIDYDNFKSEVAQHQGKAGAAYEHSLHDVWSVIYGLQSLEGIRVFDTCRRN